jgi:DEAD/DEAH box helicase domain-containing protein
VLELVAATLRSDHDHDHDGSDEGDGDARRAPDDGLLHVLRLPARPARRVPLPDDLPGLLRSRLELAGVTTLWSHQAEVRDHVAAGRDVVVATGTASGKSLAYLLPVLEALLADPTSTAVYLAPTKALARDQLRAVRALKLPQVRAAVIDGDTPREERDAIRRTANLVLTNPDLLHASLLPGHRHWSDLLHRCRFVVLDESHVARGVFGSHVALVLRRLLRLCERYDAEPRVLLASATVGNPAAHASALVGRAVTAVTVDGSPTGPRHVGLWRPPLRDPEATDGRRVSTLREAGRLLAAFVAADTRTLAFVGSRRGAEVVAQLARETLGPDHALHDRIATYRAGYLAAERRELEQRLRDGELLGLAATSALELGIDVAGLDAVLLVGWPGTTAAFHQRLGRAGRGTEPSAGVLLAGEDLLDQWLVTHPDELAARQPEDAVVDPSNPYVLAPHLRCAAHEAGLTAQDAARWFGPTAPALLDDEVAAGRLRRRGDRHHWTGRRPPGLDVGLRSVGGRDVRIVDAATGALVGTVDGARALTQVHQGAAYVHQGVVHEVLALDLDRGLAAVEATPGARHTTRPTTDVDLGVDEVLRAVDHGPLALCLGRVTVTTTVTGYDVLHPGTDEPATHVPLDLPPTELRTVAVWWTLPEDVLRDAGVTAAATPGALHAAEHAAIGMLPLLALCDRWDLGGLSTARHRDTGLPTVFVHDGHPGGAGLAERSFERFAEHVALTRDAVQTCPCVDGCPSCVQSPKCGNGNDPLDKAGAIAVLGLLERLVA